MTGKSDAGSVVGGASGDREKEEKGEKYVFLFTEGDPKDKKTLGGKGSGLCAMTQAGLPVPPGFVVSTVACRAFYAAGKRLPPGLMSQVREKMKVVERETGRVFGGTERPLLVSVRSGAAVSMPGMMDTILNLGLNDETVEALARETDNPRFAYDSYRRFISLFSKITLGVDDEYFDMAMNRLKEEKGVKADTDLDEGDMMRLVEEYKRIVEREAGRSLPSDPYEQLEMAIVGVFSSWEGRRCVDYRREFNITPDIADGTAANVQAMVFGNMGNDSATGVAFTRDPGTGENRFYGEYLTNAQGEDVVAGIRTPKPIHLLKEEMPEAYQTLEEIRHELESYYHEVQDMEFTIERGKVYILQTRNGKMTARALVRTSVDMHREGILSKEEALLRIPAESMERLLHRQLDPTVKEEPLAVGLPASPGVAVGAVVFDADEAVARKKKGMKVILLREETKPEDIHGFFASEGILTSRGGKTSHAAVVARGMGKPCVSGAEDIEINHRGRFALIGETRIAEGDIITIDGTTGRVWLGEMPTIEPSLTDEMKEVLSWADEYRRLGVRANANTPEEARRAREFGGEGIGLCRTERMFNAPDRLPLVQEMILADTEEERRAILDKLLPMQREDFKEMFRAMNGLPVTIRLLDPPLHEFLPPIEELMEEISALEKIKHAFDSFMDVQGSTDILGKDLGDIYEPLLEDVVDKIEKMRQEGVDWLSLLEKKKEVLRKVHSLAEVNPMLGHRGVRLGITYPEIYEMQVRAIFEAMAEVQREGVRVKAEIMIPQVCTAQELKWAHGLVERVVAEVRDRTGAALRYKFGTMMEVVRSCMRAGKLSEIAEFFSFGTNDLTQATFSFSREDAENKFLPLYNERKILQDNPFEIIDVKGVGRLMMIAIEWGKKTRPDLQIGVCGEHGGEPRSIHFFHGIGLDYVSCSVYRIPVARLAAAQAAIREKMAEMEGRA
ncbi:MAG: pyruvate, phosphate dikinase [Thermoplasmata archaeon]|nr:pyruvate, phosphate dikinase [Thermoplasmata archaeon]